ncbi:MAG TPA: hypothetical protein VFC23_01220 [Thermoanaerobaculia bacterium]|nr:hypothetical protein [Thermoanaerobaculia bacterium]
MLSHLHPACLLTLSLLLLPAAARAQQMTLELEPGATTLAACDTGHRLATCDFYHIETVSTASVGGALQLNGQPYVIDWMGPGYHLDSGVILELQGEAKPGLEGQRWIEVYPHESRVHTSRGWQDNDHSRGLSVSDTLTLEDGRSRQVREVRLHLRVTPKPQ